ncbi:MAG: hypothetical protein M1835_004378 [Candelina submexicana]|nr:MAG: hypothetical protein M1835_004378 [Candelina submexicana]
MSTSLYSSSSSDNSSQHRAILSNGDTDRAGQPVRDHIPRQMEDDADVDQGEDEDGEEYINPRELGEDPSAISPEDYGGYAVGTERRGDMGDGEGKVVRDHVPQMMEDDAEEDQGDDDGEEYINPKELGEDPS